MTGPEQRVLSGYHAISSVKKLIDQWEVRKDKKCSNFDLPELLHNLNLLVEISEQVETKMVIHFNINIIKYKMSAMILSQNIITNNQELCNSEGRLVVIERETSQLGENIKEKEKSIESLAKMIFIMESLNDLKKQNMLTSSEAIKQLKELKVCYKNIY